MPDSDLPIASYPMSSDYRVLTQWMRHRTIACVIDHNGRRIIAEASAFLVGETWIYSVDSVERMIISGPEDQFITRCEDVDLEFIDPRLTPETSRFATCLMWLGTITIALIITCLTILIFVAAM